ncbi:MAG: metallophosphoesterase [Candidatus Aenigmarchaeota archaeon]|nr:metallophosphoesterase [Candidatus Aenigmarchaeota archaeon]
MAKFLVIGDLHGQIPDIHFKDFDAVLFTGDVCDTGFLRDIQFRQIALKQKEPSYKMKNWFSITGKAKAKKLVKESLKGGRKSLESLNSLGVPVYLVPGNADWTKEKSTWDFLKKDHFAGIMKGLKNIKNVHKKISDTGEFQVIGYGLSFGPEFPQHKEDLRFFDEKKLVARRKTFDKTCSQMREIFKRAERPVIFLSHNVPFNTKIDRILMKESPRYGFHQGSLVTRRMVDEFQPLACIGGHMHEHYGKILLGKTICIAAGYGKDANTLLEICSRTVKVKFHKEKTK